MTRINPADLQGFLGGMDYPASRQDIVEHARMNGADRDMLDTLQSLPGDRFNSANDISEAMGRM